MPNQRARAQPALKPPVSSEARARGVARHESFDSIVALAVEVSLHGRTPRVHRVVCAIDCGSVVNPGIVAQQVESGVTFGLSAALFGRIDIDQGIVRQRNFPDYPILTLAQSPLIETHIVASQWRCRRSRGYPAAHGHAAITCATLAVSFLP